MITGKAILKPVEITFRVSEIQEIIKTVDGNVDAKVGDYILTTPEGELVCNPAVFIASYKVTKISK